MSSITSELKPPRKLLHQRNDDQDEGKEKIVDNKVASCLTVSGEANLLARRKEICGAIRCQNGHRDDKVKATVLSREIVSSEETSRARHEDSLRRIIRTGMRRKIFGVGREEWQSASKARNKPWQDVAQSCQDEIISVFETELYFPTCRGKGDRRGGAGARAQLSWHKATAHATRPRKYRTLRSKFRFRSCYSCGLLAFFFFSPHERNARTRSSTSTGRRAPIKIARDRGKDRSAREIRRDRLPMTPQGDPDRTRLPSRCPSGVLLATLVKNSGEIHAVSPGTGLVPPARSRTSKYTINPAKLAN